MAKWQIYIASCENNGGIFRYALRENGALEPIDRCPMDRPMYMALTQSHLHVVLRRPFEDSEESGVQRLDVGSGGELAVSTGIWPTLGEVACHVLVDGGDVYVTNYISGSVVKMPHTLVTHAGSGPHPRRQDAPHTHQAAFTPDEKYVCVTDLGLDRIFVYDRELRYHGQASVPAGHGPRHMAFSPDGKTAFCLNELTSDVSVFRYAAGALCYLRSVDALPEDRRAHSSAAALRVSGDGKWLYASNRGDDSISCFAVEGDHLTLRDIVPCGGKSPRDFMLTPDEARMIVTNEESGNVAVFTMEDGIPRLLNDACRLEKPLCAVCRRDG